MDIQKIKIESDYKLPDLIHEIEKGALRIPRFQRKFVWEKSKVIKLLDSMYKEFPVGSFFFWTAPKKYYFFYRDIAKLNLPKPDKYSEMSLIIDGQQRVTSLYATIKGLDLYKRDYSKICFDLDKKSFIDKRADNKRFISLKNLLSQEHLDIYNDLTPERKKNFQECRNRLINYPFSVIYVRGKELDEVCDIFERINQGGRRLSLFDLISASTWSTNFDLRDEVEKEQNNFKEKCFGKIDSEIFTQTLSLISKGPCTRSSQLQLRKEDIDNYWEDTVKTIRQAVDYLRNNLGVVHYSFIPYRGMISLVAYLFWKNDKKSLSNRQADLLSTWFWNATFSERYSASTLTQMTEDKKIFDKIALEKDVKVSFQFSLDIDSLIKVRMYRKSAIKSGVLCLLATKRPRHLKNNSLLSLGDGYYSELNSSEKHHIFPKAFLKKEGFSEAEIHSLPNFCFLPAELNKEISKKNPSDYFKKLEEENSDFRHTLRTHLIEYDKSIERDEYLFFLGSRAKNILDEIYKVSGTKISRVVEEGDSKLIDETERQIRDMIDQKVNVDNHANWEERIPRDILDGIKRRADDYIKRNPSKELSEFSPRELIDFCDLMDYPKIILVNWGIFKSFFRSKSEVEKKFINLKEYRNAVKHNREIPSFVKKEGEAAIEWLSIILNNERNRRDKVKEKKKGEKTSLQKEYLSFFNELKDRMEVFFPNKKIKPYARSYCQISSSVANIHFEWLFCRKPRKTFQIALHAESRDKDYNQRVIDKMERLKEKLERDINEKVIFERDWGKKWSRMYIQKENSEKNEELKRWAVDKMKIMIDILDPELKKIAIVRE